MDINSDDDKTSDSTETSLFQGAQSPILKSEENDINNISNISQKSDIHSSFEDENSNDAITKPLESFSEKNKEPESNQQEITKKQVQKPASNPNKNPNPRIQMINTENKNQEINNNNNNSNIENTPRNANDSKIAQKMIKTIDSERPPSGYSSYSYYYDYSDSDDGNYYQQQQEYKKGRKKKKDKKVCPTYKPPVFNISQDELSVLKKKAMNLEPLEDIGDDRYEALNLLLAEERKKCAKSENLEQSELLNKAIEHVTECQLEQRKYVLQQKTYAKYRDQMSAIQKELQEFDEKTAKKEAKLRSDINIQRCSLQQQHERQIQDLQKEWNSNSKKKQYNHASPRLLFLRKQYQQLIQQCRFKEANAVKMQISQMERKEENEAIKVMQRNFDENVNQVLKKQSEELQFFDARAQIQIKKFRQKRMKKRIPIENKESKIKVMEGKINDPDRLWNCSQMKRTMEISQGKLRDAKVSAKLAAKDLDQKEDTTIKLPQLKLRKKI